MAFILKKSIWASKLVIQGRKTVLGQEIQIAAGMAIEKVESEGPAEKYRAVIDGDNPKMNRSAKGGARSSLHF